MGLFFVRPSYSVFIFLFYANLIVKKTVLVGRPAIRYVFYFFFKCVYIDIRMKTKKIDMLAICEE